MNSEGPKLAVSDDVGAFTPTPDPVSEWISEHLEEVRAHHGNVIAVHPVRGILAAAPTDAEVKRALDALGLPPDVLDEVVLSPVPQTP